MGLFDWISSGVNAVFGSGATTPAGVSDFVKAAAPTLIGGGLSYLGAQETASAARDAAAAQAAGLQAAAADAAAQGVPYSVGSLAGTAQFDPEAKTALLNLSPELSNIYGGLLSRSGLFGQQAGELAGLDPFTAGNVFYQMGESYRQPERERLRTALETRLLSQGLLGATGGGLQKQALEGKVSEVLEQRQRELQAARDRITGTIRDASGTITGGSGQGTIDSGNTGGYGGTGGEGPSAVSSSGMLGGGV